MSDHRSFFNRRLHSLLGVIPVGFFLVNHLVTNFYATKGAQAFVNQVNFLWSIPFILFLEIFLIFLPLLYHGVYGLYVAFLSKNNVVSYSTLRNIFFMLQRVTGVITLIFVAWHVWETRIQKSLQGMSSEELAEYMHTILSNNFTFALYAIGVIAAVFHLCNGMWNFLVTWGITVGPRAQYISTWVWAIVFVAVTYLGISSLFAFAQPDFLSELAQG